MWGQRREGIQPVLSTCPHYHWPRILGLALALVELDCGLFVERVITSGPLWVAQENRSVLAAGPQVNLWSIGEQPVAVAIGRECSYLCIVLVDVGRSVPADDDDVAASSSFGELVVSGGSSEE